MTFVIEVTNQAPTITTYVRDVTMHAGDTFIVLPAYYDTFIGGSSYVNANKQFDNTKDANGNATGVKNELPTEGSTAYVNSLTFGSLYNGRMSKSGFKYYEITSDLYDYGKESDKAFNTAPSGTGGTSLGFLGLATDDAPWRMRISEVSESDYVEVTALDQTLVEGTTKTYYALSMSIMAVRACNRAPLTFTLVDGEGGTVTYTLYMTIVSSAPTPLDASVAANRTSLAKSHLEGVRSSDGEYEQGVYRTFIIPSGGAAGVSVTLENMGADNKKTAYKEVKVTLKEIATDIDGQSQVNSMALYGGGMFAVNGVTMEPDGTASDGRVKSDYFYITTTDGGKAFVIHATGYDMTRDYEELTFRIADSGNPAFENTCLVTIRVYTVYSDMTNPTVAKSTADEYDKYLAGSNEVYVKSYDEYVGLGNVPSAGIGQPSVYSFLKLNGSDGTDGNEGKAQIVDPDVTTAGRQSYATSIYAFINNDGTPLTASEIGELLVRDSANNTFAIRAGKKQQARSYIIGGITEDGTVITASDSDKLEAVNKYVHFTLAADGATMSFTPNTATLGAKIMMYVEVQKRLGTVRTVLREDDSVAAGALFRLVVGDSAPRAVAQNEFVGTKGDSRTYKLFDRDDVSGSLFNDSDIDDKIEVRDFKDNTDSSYIKALGTAADKLDWKADRAKGKDRAFTVDVDNTAGTLTVTINRRIDELVTKTDEDGNKVTKYAEEVSFSIKIVGYDMAGAKDEVTISITVVNSPITAKEEFSWSDPENESVNYTFSRNYGSSYDNEYVLNADVVYGTDLTIRLDDFLIDADYIKNTDNDSFVLVEGVHRLSGSYSYLTNRPVTAVFYEDDVYGYPQDLATVTPVYTGSGTGAQLSYTAITIHAETNLRERKGTLYLCVMDRASDTTYDETGVYIQLNVTVANDAPYVLDDKIDTTESLLGSDSRTTAVSYHIRDFVNDRNVSDYVDMSSDDADKTSATYVRIYSVSYLDYTDIWTTSAANIGGGDLADDSSLLFDVSYDRMDTGDIYDQTFIITPHVGFYGMGEVEIEVCDGNINVNSDTKYTRFRIKVSIMYNPDDIAAFNGVSTARGKTQVVTMESLVPDVNNTFGGVSSASKTGSSVMPSKNAGSFNPATWYVLKSVSLPEESKNYAEITQTSETEWSLHALVETSEAKRVEIKYALKSDETAEFDGFFLLNVTANLQPLLLYKRMTFERHPADEEVNVMYHLNTNNTVYLTTSQLFDDPEDDVVRFVSVKSNKSSLVSATLAHDNEHLAIRFTARGTADITVTVADETGNNYSYVITVTNTDLESPSLWTRLLASFESSKVMWAVIIGLVILALIILIIVIAVLRKRRQAREELEALLVSEMEIEEQMLKLAGGPSPTGYQSYGYLQSAPGQTVDPNMLIGPGAQMPTGMTELGLPPVQGDPQAPQAPAPDNTNPYDGM